MAIHDDVPSLFREAVDEYLTAAKLCIGYQKTEGGILGYPAALILFCLVDAMGQNLKREEKHKLRYKGEFLMLGHSAMGLKLSDHQIAKLAKWYRNKLAHSALIAPNVLLRGEDQSAPFSFSAEAEPIAVFLKPFYRTVKAAWEALGPTAFDPNAGVAGPDTTWEGVSSFTPPASGMVTSAPPTREEIEKVLSSTGVPYVSPPSKGSRGP